MQKTAVGIIVIDRAWGIQRSLRRHPPRGAEPPFTAPQRVALLTRFAPRSSVLRFGGALGDPTAP